MSFDDFSSRLKKANQKTAPQDEMREFDPQASFALRGKMLGVLIRDARLSAARTIDECARLLRVPASTVEAWEYGDAVPSLPQLELLAYYLDVPVSHFWSQKTLEENKAARATAQDEYLLLRQRMIGALIGQAREETGLALADVAEQTHIKEATLERYENGEVAIPMSHLPLIASAVNRNLDYFIETSGFIGELLKIHEEWQKFTDLDPEIREFAANPLNIGFIKIAITFSKMPVDQLRKAAEGMLEISM